MERLTKQPEVNHDEMPLTRWGKVRYAAAMWLLGMPLPIILIALFVRGCDW